MCYHVGRSYTRCEVINILSEVNIYCIFSYPSLNSSSTNSSFEQLFMHKLTVSSSFSIPYSKYFISSSDDDFENPREVRPCTYKDPYRSRAKIQNPVFFPFVNTFNRPKFWAMHGFPEVTYSLTTFSFFKPKKWQFSVLFGIKNQVLYSWALFISFFLHFPMGFVRDSPFRTPFWMDSGFLRFGSRPWIMIFEKWIPSGHGF